MKGRISDRKFNQMKAAPQWKEEQKNRKFNQMKAAPQWKEGVTESSTRRRQSLTKEEKAGHATLMDSESLDQMDLVTNLYLWKRYVKNKKNKRRRGKRSTLAGKLIVTITGWDDGKLSFHRKYSCYEITARSENNPYWHVHHIQGNRKQPILLYAHNQEPEKEWWKSEHILLCWER